MASFDFTTEKQPLSAYSMAGLADIILLLLIFFILTSSFVTQFGIQVTLPKAEAGSMTDQSYVGVAITKEGRYYVQQKRVSEDNLMAAIREAKENRSSLVLRADEEATVRQFATVANIAKALNLRILMATEREPRR
jgi:biopolymer transport protein ExbD